MDFHSVRDWRRQEGLHLGGEIHNGWCPHHSHIYLIHILMWFSFLTKPLAQAEFFPSRDRIHTCYLISVICVSRQTLIPNPDRVHCFWIVQLVLAQLSAEGLDHMRSWN
jgi:hypothetical protein